MVKKQDRNIGVGESCRALKDKNLKIALVSDEDAVEGLEEESNMVHAHDLCPYK